MDMDNENLSFNPALPDHGQMGSRVIRLSAKSRRKRKSVIPYYAPRWEPPSSSVFCCCSRVLARV